MLKVTANDFKLLVEFLLRIRVKQICTL